MALDDDDRMIRALELDEDSPEYCCLVAEILANARLAYADEAMARKKLELFVAEVTGLKQAEDLIGRRLDFC